MKTGSGRRMAMATIVGVVIGGAVGFGIYRFIGCRTGACPITANPYASVAYGALMGLLLSFPK